MKLSIAIRIAAVLAVLVATILVVAYIDAVTTGTNCTALSPKGYRLGNVLISGCP